MSIRAPCPPPGPSQVGQIPLRPDYPRQGHTRTSPPGAAFRCASGGALPSTDAPRDDSRCTASAVFLADLLGLEPPTSYGPFSVVQVGDTSLDFADDHAAPHGLQPQHYAFLVSEADFDA